MTTIGVLAASILASLLIAVLDMGVYHESFGYAIYKQSLAYNRWQTYLMVIVAFIVALSRDLRSYKRFRGGKQSKKTQRSSGEQHRDRLIDGE
jgi:hypothetical protein